MEKKKDPKFQEKVEKIRALLEEDQFRSKAEIREIVGEDFFEEAYSEAFLFEIHDESI